VADVLRDRLELEKRLYAIIDEAAAMADLGQSIVRSHIIAERIFTEQPELMADLFHLWAVDRLLWMVTRRRREKYRERWPSLQLVLDDPIFKGLPETIYLRNGRRPKLDHCTVPQVEEYLKSLRERYIHHRKVGQMEAVLDKMRLYSGEKRGITWGEVKTRIAEALES
jgi:hypothetical protein